LGGFWAVGRKRGREGEGLGPAVAHAGRGEEARERKGVGLAGLFSFPFLFSKLNLFTQIYLNSNKFEFKPYTLNTNKTMLQHECTNMLTLQ
jgi:hypothetical protein